jgi:ADP-ribose pyrophosphatase YjhB (NUDIX family)
MTAGGVRVAVYVTRERGGHREVLVVDHHGAPGAGAQIPTVGVGPDERLEMAARREVEKETGVALADVGAPLAVQQRPQTENGTPRVTVFFHATTDEVRDAWTHKDDFECFFVPVNGVRKVLRDHQGEFVDLIQVQV